MKQETTVPLIRHHVSNLRIEIVSPAEARGACYFLVVTEHGVDHWGRYRDRYVPDGDRWLFAHRFVRTDGTTPGGWADREPPASLSRTPQSGGQLQNTLRSP